MLGSIPQDRRSEQQEIDGLPEDFDGWVFGVVARAIPCLTAAEDPRSLWQPILDLGSPGHHWVERFFWYWFTDGLQGRASPEDFVRLWTGMIEHALTSPAWDPSVNHSYDLAGMVFQLLGFATGMNKLGQNPAFTAGRRGNGRRICAGRAAMVRQAEGRHRLPEFRHGAGHGRSSACRESDGWRRSCRPSIPTTGNTVSRRI